MGSYRGCLETMCPCRKTMESSPDTIVEINGVCGRFRKILLEGPVVINRLLFEVDSQLEGNLMKISVVIDRSNISGMNEWTVLFFVRSRSMKDGMTSVLRRTRVLYDELQPRYSTSINAVIFSATPVRWQSVTFVWLKFIVIDDRSCLLMTFQVLLGSILTKFDMSKHPRSTLGSKGEERCYFSMHSFCRHWYVLIRTSRSTCLR